jgi:hypothetical protein
VNISKKPRHFLHVFVVNAVVADVVHRGKHTAVVTKTSMRGGQPQHFEPFAESALAPLPSSEKGSE